MDSGNKRELGPFNKARVKYGESQRGFDEDRNSYMYSNSVKLLTRMKFNLDQTLNELNYIKVRANRCLNNTSTVAPKTIEPVSELPKEKPEQIDEMIEQPTNTTKCETIFIEDTENIDVAVIHKSSSENSTSDSEESIESENDLNVFCSQPLFQAVLLDLHPQVSFDEVKDLLADVNLNEVDDLTLVNNKENSHSVVTFPTEEMLKTVLSFDNKLTHRGRLIKVRHYNSNNLVI